MVWILLLDPGRGSAEYKDVAAMIPNGHRPIEAGSASCRAMFLLCPYAPPLTEPQGPPVRGEKGKERKRCLPHVLFLTSKSPYKVVEWERPTVGAGFRAISTAGWCVGCVSSPIGNEGYDMANHERCDYQLAGNLFRPRSTKLCRQSDRFGSSIEMLGKRRNKVEMASSASMRAS